MGYFHLSNPVRAALSHLLKIIKAPSSCLVILMRGMKTRLNLVNNLMQKYGLDSVVLSQDERVRFLGYPLDYIFTRGVKVVSATSEVVTSSDHNPLLMEFELE